MEYQEFIVEEVFFRISGIPIYVAFGVVMDSLLEISEKTNRISRIYCRGGFFLGFLEYYKTQGKLNRAT